MHYIEVYFCQQSEFGDSTDSSIKYIYLMKKPFTYIKQKAMYFLEGKKAM